MDVNRQSNPNNRVIVAHRGASGYLPEHTLPSKALAYGMGAHFLEQDVVLTKDDHPIVLHDRYLDTTTNVKKIFPDRCRKNGRYYAMDFTLGEIKQLSVSERINPSTGEVVYSTRFPYRKSRFEVSTLQEEIELIQGLNKSMNRDVGIYPELKAPRFHTSEGKDITTIVLTILHEYGYQQQADNCFVQCFDTETLRRIHQENLTGVPLIQLIGEENAEWEAILNGDLDVVEWLDNIAQYADGISPTMELLYDIKKSLDRPAKSSMVKRAHDLGLLVHPYNVQADVLPKFSSSMEELLEILFGDLNVDGVFTDFPDRAVHFLQTQNN